MSVKNCVLDILEENKNTYFSGEELAKMLSVTRTSIWKAVKSLQKDGYDIVAVTNKGYMLKNNDDCDIISEFGIKKYLNENLKCTIIVKDVVTSTNLLIKEMAKEGNPEGTILIANEQTKGRGRFQRNFYSPKGSGIYMSILLRPTFLPVEKSIQITTIASIAMCQAIEKNCDVSPYIKWVNDIFVHNKKVCGILTEGSLNIETGLFDSVVLGVGLNIYAPENDFPEELSNIAGSLLDKKKSDIKNKIISDFINLFFEYYLNFDSYNLVDKYRDYSFILNKKISVIKGDLKIDALALNIDDNYRLVVKYEDGTIETLSSGEISIKVLS